MKSVTISEAKNKLSELLVAVRAGEGLTIMDRKLPIARVEAIREIAGNPHVSAPRAVWNPTEIVALPIGKIPGKGATLSDTVAEERGAGW